jgi:hypothetical protein
MYLGLAMHSDALKSAIADFSASRQGIGAGVFGEVSWLEHSPETGLACFRLYQVLQPQTHAVRPYPHPRLLATNQISFAKTVLSG